MHRIMHRIRTAFQGLGWKLTLSYTLVTVAALLVAEIALLGVAFWLVGSTDLLARLFTQSLVASGNQLAPYLEEQPVDLKNLQRWLDEATANGITVVDEEGVTSQFFPGSLGGGERSMLLVVDAHQQILAATPAHQAGFGARYQPPGGPAQQAVLSAALSGDTVVDHLFSVDDQRYLLAAAPVQAADGQTLGALVFYDSLPSLGEPMAQLLSLLGSSLIFFTLSAALVGTFFGWITSRSLARRLKRVSTAADAWSQGDFSAYTQDSSQDEIGQLARRLNRMAEQLENLLQTRQELATLEERNRLARDLHDSVKQQVFATVMQVGAARTLLERDPQAARTHLEEAEALGRQAQTELTTLIRELRPATLQGRGLAPALKDYVAGWGRQNEVQVEVSFQGERPLPLEVEQALFRIAQEALSNAARHSQATRLQIHLAWEADGLSLGIEDNGSGFQANLSGSGVGLHSMQERVEALGGRLKIQTAPGQGTRVQVWIPNKAGG